MNFGTKLRENLDGMFSPKPKAERETTTVFKFGKEEVIRALGVEGKVADIEVKNEKLVITVIT